MKLIGKNIIGKTIIVECEDKKEMARKKRAYAKVGIALFSYDTAIKREAKRLIERPDDAPEFAF